MLNMFNMGIDAQCDADNDGDGGDVSFFILLFQVLHRLTFSITLC